MGEHRNFILLPMAIAAMKQVLQWGVPRISATLQELTAQIEHKARALGFQTVPAHHRVGHLIGLRYSSELPVQLTMELAQSNVFVSVRGNSIRISPHLYNTTDDIDRLFYLLGRLL